MTSDAGQTPTPVIAAALAVAAFYLGPRGRNITMSDGIETAMAVLWLKFDRRYRNNPDADHIRADITRVAARVTLDGMNAKQRKAAVLALVDSLIATMDHPAPTGQINPEYLDMIVLPQVANAVRLGVDYRTAVDVALLQTGKMDYRAELYGDILWHVATVAETWTPATRDASKGKQIDELAVRLRNARHRRALNRALGLPEGR